MAQKFLTLEEAAQQLGLSKEKLNQLREDGKVHAYRDGMGWKFKSEAVDQLAIDLREGNLDSDDDDALDLDLFGGENDSILLSEVELGESGGPSSTIIGKTDGRDSGQSDVRLAEPAGDSDLKLDDAADLTLDSGDASEPSPSNSDVLASSPDTSATSDTVGSGISQFDSIEELEFDLETASGVDLPTSEALDSPQSNDDDISLDSSASGLSLDAGMSGLTFDDAGSGLSLDTGSSDLSLGNSDLMLDTGDSAKSNAAADLSDVALAAGSSGIELADEDDDELVLGESTGSDITLGSGDSGISLLGPSDSGLSLDSQPLELGGSTVETLDLGDDDEILLEEEGGSESATQLKTDEDFLLTPLDDAGGDMDDDSSQVIALDSESFDESADTMLGGGDALGLGLPASAAGTPVEMGMQGGLGGAALAASSMPAFAAEPETPYTVWNVVSLILCFVMLALTGTMLFDLIRNMWSWDQPYALNSSIMDALMKAVPIFKQ